MVLDLFDPGRRYRPCVATSLASERRQSTPELMRKTPIKRKTPLKRSTKPIRRSRPKARSVKAESHDEWRASEHLVVISRYWCEAWWPDHLNRVDRVVCGQVGTEVHHNFGRTNEPWSSWRYMCSLLCRDHHADVTGRVGKGLDKELRFRLRIDAAKRTLKALNFTPLPSVHLTDDEWLQILRGWPTKHTVPPDYKRFEARQ